jgi:hypothetical protein
MDYLALCRSLTRECGISGEMSSALNQAGEFAQVASWVNSAWRDIQLENTNWRWMRDEFTFQTVPGTPDYTPTSANAADFSKWHLDTLRAFRTATGTSDDAFMRWWEWQDFRNRFMFGAQSSYKPTEFATRPRDNALVLGPAPDGIYTVYGEYQRRATLLTADDQSPGIPEEYHMIIVHRARLKYAFDENAPEVMADAQREHNRLMGALTETQLDSFDLGCPLA